jgi:DNA gyrase/topoisomerase IV subunit B
MMSHEQKIDLLLHELIPSEVHLLLLLLDTSNKTVLTTIEDALNTQIYKKYEANLAFLSSSVSLQLINQRVKSSSEQDRKLLEYALYLKSQFSYLKKQTKQKETIRRQKVMQSNAVKKELLNLAIEFNSKGRNL